MAKCPNIGTQEKLYFDRIREAWRGECGHVVYLGVGGMKVIV